MIKTTETATSKVKLHAEITCTVLTSTAPMAFWASRILGRRFVILNNSIVAKYNNRSTNQLKRQYEPGLNGCARIRAGQPKQAESRHQSC